MKSLCKLSMQDQTIQPISDVRETFDLWRAARQKKGPLPEELWSSAVALCARHSISEVSQALRLNYTDLQNRVNGRNGSVKTKIPKVTFVDVNNPCQTESSGRGSECLLEIRDAEGFSVKMHCRGEACVDLVSLCRIIIDRR
jgi:hypothetical protein